MSANGSIREDLDPEKPKASPILETVDNGDDAIAKAAEVKPDIVSICTWPQSHAELVKRPGGQVIYYMDEHGVRTPVVHGFLNKIPQTVGKTLYEQRGQSSKAEDNRNG